ncbi:MAG: ABC transporter ATP-binding protein [Alphaproteobacteria bacterium]|nr:ABC transporter ATP-binding protein [Alphaproteobacteria bacterium]
MSPAGGASSGASSAGSTFALRARIESKRFPAVGNAPPKHVVQDVTLDVPENGFVALFGPSGCGKTTILNLLAGLDTDFDGEIDRRAEDRIAYVFQEPRLLPWLTVEDNLKLVLEDGIDAAPLIDRWLDEMGLADVRNVFANRLSLGMARRVALARAFIIHPRVLLMDEPFVSLDEPTAIRLHHLLLDTLASHPAAVVFVTHSLREAITLADRIVFLSKAPTSLRRIADVPLSPNERRDEKAIERLRTQLIKTG